MGPPEGRTYDMMVMPSGRTFTPFVISHWVSQASPGSHFRIIQHRPDHLEVLFVNTAEDEHSVSTRLRQKFEGELKEPVQVDIRRVDNIPNDGSKYRSFVRKFEL
jgi:phenylacetate-coenzyme A ligase PaaK-like adenylate-forming protein